MKSVAGYKSFDEWTRDVRETANPPRDDHHVTRDGRVLDTPRKTLAWLREVGALREDVTTRR